MKRKLWISWERQRRTIELSQYFDCNLYLIIYERQGLVRYIKSLLKTFWVILKEKPQILFVQNPSLLLSTYAVLLKPFFGYELIVDRHTNFKFDKRKLPQLKWKIFWCLSNFTLRHADYTIVTNKPLKRIVDSLGANGVVLQDKVPEMIASNDYELSSKFKYSALFVCTYADDEPVEELIESFTELGLDYALYLSGNWKKKWSANEKGMLPENIIPTGFLSEGDFSSLMSQVDAVIVFTTNDYTLTCGAYEALALNKPALLSNKAVLVNYFGDSCRYCNEGSPSSISDGVHSLFSKDWIHSSERLNKINSIKLDWNARAEDLKKLFDKKN